MWTRKQRQIFLLELPCFLYDPTNVDSLISSYKMHIKMYMSVA